MKFNEKKEYEEVKTYFYVSKNKTTIIFSIINNIFNKIIFFKRLYSNNIN